MGAGVRPRQELAEACGLELGGRGGIKVRCDPIILPEKMGKWVGVIGLRQVGSGIFQNELFSGKVYVFNSLTAPLCWG